MSVLDTTRKLIALALDTKGASENERRNAALKAVELIHEHKLLESPASYVPPAPTWTAPFVDDSDEYIETVIKGPYDGWERAIKTGLCSYCRTTILFGDLIPAGLSDLHLRCWLQKRRGRR